MYNPFDISDDIFMHLFASEPVWLVSLNDILSEPISKRSLLPNLCACPVECEAYSSGVILKF